MLLLKLIGLTVYNIGASKYYDEKGKLTGSMMYKDGKPVFEE